MDIIERLLEDAIHHDDMATQCDCRPDDTVNHDHAVNARDAAKEIKNLRTDNAQLQFALEQSEAKFLTPNAEITGSACGVRVD